MNTGFEPAYVKLLHSGELEQRAAQVKAHMQRCDLCAWECRVDRTTGKLGVCRTGVEACVAGFGPHMGEEDPLRGWHGSGTIFFSFCNLRCQFCQNHEIAQGEEGEPVSITQLAGMMLSLQEIGVHNINLVSPSHVVAQIIEAVWLAAQEGLRLPLVYNTGGYDSLTALQLLDGIIDIYMPDMKFATAGVGLALSKAKHYPEVNQAAVREMHRQVGDLQLDEHGLALRGLLVRHLLLPNQQSGAEAVLHFLAEQVSPNTYVNLMDGYYPSFMVKRYPNQFAKINRPVKPEEHQAALQMARQAGLTRLDKSMHGGGADFYTNSG